MVALIGANGAGKTTTLKAICGMLQPAAGKIFYGGEEVTGTPSFSWWSRGWRWCRRGAACSAA